MTSAAFAKRLGSVKANCLYHNKKTPGHDARPGIFYSNYDPYFRLGSSKVLPDRISPESYPFLNHSIRWADVPCVNDSGTA